MTAALAQQLGGNFTQMTLTDHLHTDFVKEGGGLPTFVVAAIAIAASIATAGAAAAATGVVMTQLSIGSVLIGALGGMVGSAVGQLASGEGLNFSQILEAGAIGALTAGAMSALHVADIASLKTLGSEIANGAVKMADLGNALEPIGERGLVNATVNTAIEGGSFGQAFENSVISDLGAVGANAIGVAAGNKDSWLAEKSVGNVLAHAGLGCALSAAEGTGCAGGAIGGAASALVAPYLVSAAGGAQNLTDGQRAAIVGISTLLGGVTAGLAGQNAQAGATAAENEALNNSTGDHRTEAQKDADELKKEMSQFDSKLPGNGKVVIGTDGDGEPEYAYKPPASLFAGGGATGSSQGAAGNTVRVSGGSSFEVDVGNGTGDWGTGGGNQQNRVPLLPAPKNSEPWISGTVLNSFPSPSGGMYIQMAMAPGQTSPGGWGTTDFIPDLNYVRSSLAVTPAFKADVSTVQLFYIPAGVQLQVGTVGPQLYDDVVYPGGGNQVQILNYRDRGRLVPIGPPRKIN
jgi:hypothetical protein